MPRTDYLSPYYEPRRGVGHARLDLSLDISDSDRFEMASIEAWRDELRASPADSEMDVLVSCLGKFFEFIGARNDPKQVAKRVWAVLYLVRPDLIGYETYKSAAARFGCSGFSVKFHVDAFRSAFPSVRFPSRPGGISETKTVYRVKQQNVGAGRKSHADFKRYVAERDELLAS